VFSVRRTLTLLALLVGLVKLCACSVVLDTDVRQCRRNEDCARFANSICDVDQLVCVPRPLPPPKNDASVSSLDAAPAPDAAPPDVVAAMTCLGKNGCYACAPKSDPDFFNACTDGRCVPFDNKRLHNLAADGTLKPLP